MSPAPCLLADVVPDPVGLAIENPVVLIAAGVLGLIAIGALGFFVSRMFSAAEAPIAQGEDALALDVGSLPQSGPPAKGPQLACYNVPVRVAAFVLAPVGRTAALPPPDKLREVVDRIVPGMMEIIDRHQPVFRRWPGQISSQGFGSAFVGKLRLPGESGKGTPWTAVVGKIDYQGQQLLAGIVLRADEPNGLGVITLERETQWLDVFRVTQK